MSSGQEYDYEGLNRRLSDLLHRIGEGLTSKERQTIQEYLDANELGLALEVMLEFAADNGAAVSWTALRRAEVLADEMKIRAEIEESLQRLRRAARQPRG